MQTRMSPDDVAWEQAEEVSDNWLAQFLNNDILSPIGYFMLDHNGGIGTEFAILKKGSYNISLRFKDKHEATIIRLSQPGAVFFPEEKVVNEVAVMRFLMDKTSISIPLSTFRDKEGMPLELSPFIIMDYIESEMKMYDALNAPVSRTRSTIHPSRAGWMLREGSELHARRRTVRLSSLTSLCPFVGDYGGVYTLKMYRTCEMTPSGASKGRLLPRDL